MISLFPAYFRNNQPATAYYKLVILRSSILMLSCFLCGPLFAELPSSRYFWQNFGPKFVTFLSLFFLWEITLAYLSSFIFIADFNAAARWKKTVLLIPVFFMTLTCFYFLSHFEQKIEENTFFVIVALLGLRGFAQGLYLNEQLKYMLISIYIYIFCVANLSAHLITDLLTWQFVVLSFSLIAGLLSQTLISLMLQSLKLAGKKDKQPISIALLRINVFLLFIAPVSILFMQYFGYLDRRHLLVLFCVAPIVMVAEKTRALEKSTGQNKYNELLEIEKLSCFSSLLFIFTVAAAIFISI